MDARAGQRSDSLSPDVEALQVKRVRLLASLTLMAGVGLLIALPFALRAGAEFFLPVTAALVIAIALVPMLEWFERRGVPSKLSSLLCVLVFLAIAAVALPVMVEIVPDETDVRVSGFGPRDVLRHSVSGEIDPHAGIVLRGEFVTRAPANVRDDRGVAGVLATAGVVVETSVAAVKSAGEIALPFAAVQRTVTRPLTPLERSTATRAKTLPSITW